MSLMFIYKHVRSIDIGAQRVDSVFQRRIGVTEFMTVTSAKTKRDVVSDHFGIKSFFQRTKMKIELKLY